MQAESSHNLLSELDAHRKNIAMYDRQFNDTEEFTELRHRALMLREMLLCAIDAMEAELTRRGVPIPPWEYQSNWNLWDEYCVPFEDYPEELRGALEVGWVLQQKSLQQKGVRKIGGEQHGSR